MSFEIAQPISWEKYSETLPLVAFTGLVGENMTIYACLQQAVKVFDHIVVFGDGPTKEALEMFHKFLSDHHSLKHKIQYIDQTNIDPWPWIGFIKTELDWKDKLNQKNNIGELMTKSWSKAAAKKLNAVRGMFPNSMLFSLHSDVIMFNDSRERLKQRIRAIKNPFFDSEWFCMNTCLDLDNLISITSSDSTEGNLNKHPELAQRKVYDYPGDWGLMCLYSSSCLSIGPDPMAPVAECLYPWQKSTQCEKKGHDTNVPYAVHLEFWRESYHQKDFKQWSWKYINIESLEKTDEVLYRKYKDLDMKNNLYFPKKLVVDSEYRSIVI
jgi:hypothetical protein